MTSFDLGLAAFLLLWGAPFAVAGVLGAWRPALALAALPLAFAAWGLLDAFAFDPRPAAKLRGVEIARMALLISATSLAHYAAGRWLGLRDREKAA